MAAELRPNMRVVLTSGFTGRNFEQDGPLPWPLLSKPYRRAQLAAALHMALADKSNSAAA